MLQVAQTSFDEIKTKMQGNIAGRISLDLATAVARLNFLLKFAAWILRFSSIVMELVLLAASPVIMVSVSLPDFDPKHPGDLYLLALKGLVAAADVLIAGGLFSVVEKFVHKQKGWGVFLGFFWLILTVLTFVALASPMKVLIIDEEGLRKILYWRTIDSLVYSALSLVAIVYTHVKEPELQPAQQSIIQTLTETIIGLEKRINTLSKPNIDYGQMTEILSARLPQITLPDPWKKAVSPEEIQSLEERILSQFHQQNSEVISLINDLLKTGAKSPENSEENTPELPLENNEDISTNITRDKTSDISTNITPDNTEVKAPKIPQEKPDNWDDVIAKFPLVIQWQLEGLRSVSIEQIIEVTNFSKNKIGRAKLAQTRNGNKRIESVLIWLKNEPVKTEVKKVSNTQPLSPEIMDEITPENTSVISKANTDELEEFITSPKTNNTIKLYVNDLPPEIYPNSVPDDGVFGWMDSVNTDPELAVVE